MCWTAQVATCLRATSVAFILTALVPHSSNGTPQFVGKWGSAGSGAGQWGNCLGIAVDDSQHVFLVDETNHRVEKFSSTGDFMLQWGSFGTASGQFSFPTYIAVDASSNVYVTDTGNNRVQKFSPMGVFLASWGSTGDGPGQFVEPLGIALDDSGHVYVADRGDQDQQSPPFLHWRVEKFTTSGTFITQWGMLGSEPGNFLNMSGIATDGANRVYVLDPSFNNVSLFDRSGNFITRWGTVGTGNGQFQSAGAIAVDKADGGRVYVSDFNNHRVQGFDPTGSFLESWGGFGTLDGQFQGAGGLAVSGVGFIYAGDFVGHRVQKFVRSTLLNSDQQHSNRARLSVSPNPARSSCRFALSLPVADRVRMEIFDVSGAIVRRLADLPLGSGTHSLGWDARDDQGVRVPPGVYWARIGLSGGTAHCRVLVLD